MMVMKPYDVNATVLTSSSIPEPDTSVGEVEWVDVSQKVDIGDTALEYIGEDGYVRFIDFSSFKIMLARTSFYVFDHPTIADFTQYAYGVSGLCSSHYYDQSNNRLLIGGTFGAILSIDLTTLSVTSFGGTTVSANLANVTSIKSIYSVIYAAGVSLTDYDKDGVGAILKISGTSVTSYLSITGNFYDSVDDGESIYFFGDAYIKKFTPARWSLESDSFTTLVTFSSTSSTVIISSPVIIGDNVYGINNSGVVARGKDDSSYGSLIYSSLSLGGICEINGDLFITGYNVNGKISTSGVEELIYNENESIATIGTSIIDGDVYSVEVSTNYITTPNNIIKYKSPYEPGDIAILSSTHKIYKCATESIISPDIGVQLDTPEWIEYGYTNRYKQFTNAYDSQSEYSGIINVFDFGEVVTAVGLLGVEAETAQVVINDPTDGEVYNEIVDLADAGVNNWWDWFFKPYDSIDNYVFSGLPPYPDATVTVTLDNGTSAAKCGLMLSGLPIDLGDTDTDTEVGIINYTTRSRDEFGNLTTSPKRSINYCNYAITCEIGDVNNIKRLLRDIADTQALFIGEPDMDATIVYGVAEDFRLNYSGVSICNYTLEVKGA